MENNLSVFDKKTEEVKNNEVIDISSFNMDLKEMEEMEPIESPAFIWGKWNFVGS